MIKSNILIKPSLLNCEKHTNNLNSIVTKTLSHKNGQNDEKTNAIIKQNKQYNLQPNVQNTSTQTKLNIPKYSSLIVAIHLER